MHIADDTIRGRCQWFALIVQQFDKRGPLMFVLASSTIGFKVFQFLITIANCDGIYFGCGLVCVKQCALFLVGFVFFWVFVFDCMQGRQVNCSLHGTAWYGSSAQWAIHGDAGAVQTQTMQATLAKA